MARVLLSYYTDYGEAMYDAISDTLRQNGNDIFRLNINCPKVYITKWGGESQVVEESLLADIKRFNPDVVFNFNNCLPINCYAILEESCKICIIDADAPSVAFWNVDAIKKHFNRVFFLGLQSCSKRMYEDFIGFGIELSSKKYLYFPPATVVKNCKLKQDKNISFIGSNFYPLSIPEGEDFYGEVGLQLFDAFKKNYFLTLPQVQKICAGRCSSPEWMMEKVRAYYAGQDRLKYMQQLTDLGFTFYGVRWWNKIAYYDFELAKCFDPTPKTTIEENQWVYNTSKISVNFSHPLARSSFSWRVMDIMASNSCLLMEDKPDWHELFDKYLSQETLETVIYSDRFDMRDKAIRLLNDESLRLRCVKDLNNAIERNGRWELRFRVLGEFLGINFLKLKNNHPTYIIVSRESGKITKSDEGTAKPEEKSSNKLVGDVKLKYRNFKNKYKLMFYLFVCFFAQIPPFSLFYKDRDRVRFLKKINKWWW